MDATMLLCDAAQESGGKLYILGGGWTTINQANVPVNMALAVKLDIPWDQTNRQIKLIAKLVDADGQPVENADGEPIQVLGELEVGRPPGIKAGTPIDTPFVLNFSALSLDEGGYAWLLEIDDNVVARTPFRVQNSR